MQHLVLLKIKANNSPQVYVLDNSCILAAFSCQFSENSCGMVNPSLKTRHSISDTNGRRVTTAQKQLKVYKPHLIISKGVHWHFGHLFRSLLSSS